MTFYVKFTNECITEFAFWRNRFRTQHCLCGSKGSISSPVWWVKDFTLFQLWHGLQLKLGLDPKILHMLPKKKKKKERIAFLIKFSDDYSMLVEVYIRKLDFLVSFGQIGFQNSRSQVGALNCQQQDRYHRNIQQEWQTG